MLPEPAAPRVDPIPCESQSRTVVKCETSTTTSATSNSQRRTGQETDATAGRSVESEPRTNHETIAESKETNQKTSAKNIENEDSYETRTSVASVGESSINHCTNSRSPKMQESKPENPSALYVRQPARRSARLHQQPSPSVRSETCSVNPDRSVTETESARDTIAQSIIEDRVATTSISQSSLSSSSDMLRIGSEIPDSETEDLGTRVELSNDIRTGPPSEEERRSDRSRSRLSLADGSAMYNISMSHGNVGWGVTISNGNMIDSSLYEPTEASPYYRFVSLSNNSTQDAEGQTVATVRACTSHHYHNAVVIAQRSENASETALRTALDRAIAGTIAAEGVAEGAVASNIINTLYRLQCWDLNDGKLPDLLSSTSNVIASSCKLHNDGSLDISQDSSLVAAFVHPSGFPENGMVRVFSLLKENFAQCIFSRTFGKSRR